MLLCPLVGASPLLLSLALLSFSAAQTYVSSNNTTPRDNNANCSCYVVQTGKRSQSPAYFQYYRFYDFRSLQDALSSPPPLINGSQDAGSLPSWQDSTFDSDAWNTDWLISTWSKPATVDGPVAMNYSRANVYIATENNASYLVLRTSRTDNFQTAAELENQQRNIMHVSMRMYARVRGARGAVAGFFTYFDDNNESDVEILTNDPPSQIRYTNQPSVDKNGNVIEKASSGPSNLPVWDQWRVHRIDWLPKMSYWYIDGQQTAANSYSVPRKPSEMMLNMWSDGGVWSGNMTIGQSAELQIQWIDITFNTSGPYQGIGKAGDRLFTPSTKTRRKVPRCANVCTIDRVAELGTPEILIYNRASVMVVSWPHLWVLTALVAVVLIC